MSDFDFVYGWGRTKHIRDPNPGEEWQRSERGLCGAAGGHAAEPKRPVCKTCARIVGVETPEAELTRLRTESAALEGALRALAAEKLPCVDCGKVHAARADGNYTTWKASDGHPYREMTPAAFAAVALLAESTPE